jgi:hypothetical protein
MIVKNLKKTNAPGKGAGHYLITCNNQTDFSFSGRKYINFF